MIHIQQTEPGTEWEDWKQKADKETRQIVEDAEKGIPVKLKTGIWKKLKPLLEKRFKKKCAYCEGKYIAGTSLDVEHYRPKAKVTTNKSPNSTIKITGPGGKKIDHPGYYWLAYNWKNLLLSCPKCNRENGKMNQFPIKGKRACCPGDSLNDEEPLLMNPYEEKIPGQHFSTTGVDGYIKGETRKGTKTIEICDLNRESLRISRQEEWNKRKLSLVLNLFQGGDDKIVTDDMEYSYYLKEALLKNLEALPQEAINRT
ncbi:MAG: hypothetical protein GY755_23250 [Chloroflexi bacterium]|nr:hypothetical protein [Chloroflexota bacterium]